MCVLRVSGRFRCDPIADSLPLRRRAINGKARVLTSTNTHAGCTRTPLLDQDACSRSARAGRRINEVSAARTATPAMTHKATR